MKLAFQKSRKMNNSNEKKSILDIINNEWRAVLAALHFLTVIPSFSHKPFDVQELGRSVGYYPVIGGLIGLSLFGVDRLLSFIFPPSVTGALVIVFWAAISGGFHFDGFLDSCDGILGGANPEDRLNIMKDERVGAFALIGGILLIAIKLSAINSMDIYRDQALILAPIISRWGMSIAIVGYPYGRMIGLGKDIKSFAKKREALIATFIVMISAAIIAGLPGLSITVIAFIFIIGISRFIMRRIPGLTGDSYGAINELVEVLVLISFTAVIKIF